MATLSLYLFNLLPLPFLDGTQLLDAALNFVFRSFSAVEEVDLEALEGGNGRGRMHGHRSRRWKQWATRTIKSGTVGLSVGCVTLGAINWILAH
jgi:S2P endopeptidase